MLKLSFSPAILPIALLAALLAGCAGDDKKALNIAPQAIPADAPKVVAEALQLQGRPYVYGGASPSQGFDCSGLVYYVYNRQGLRLPRDTFSLATQLPAVHPEQRRPGDLLFFNTDKPYSHVGIYVGDDRFVHAPSSRTGRVMVSDLNQPYWRERFIGVRRPPSQPALSMNEACFGG
ncbi:C40 family peptidase [Methylomonas sp. MED-D]